MHDRAQALAAVEEAASAFDTFNLDIMYALPGQTLAQMEQDMQQALQLAPPHISIYHLTIEPNTYFAKFPPAIPEDDLAYAMLDRITEMTGAAGLARYEISAYARSGPPVFSQHQLLAVWRLSGHWCGRAQQAELCAPRGAAGALSRPSPLHGQRPGRPRRGAGRRCAPG